jgi:ABC-type antimicrobial peptide transport system permease subunit
MKQAVLIVGAGLLIGFSAAAFLATSLSSVLYGISPYDAPSFMVGSILVAFVAFVVCLAPARRAVRVDPLLALKSE